MKKAFTLILMIMLSTAGFSNVIDSLKNVAKHSNNDTLKSKLYLTICDQAYYRQPESLNVYVKRTFNFARRAGQKRIQFQAMNILGYYYRLTGDNDSALKVFSQNIKLARVLGDSSYFAAVYGNIANCYVGLGRYDSAVVFYQKTLNIFEKLNNIEGIATVYGAMGDMYLKNNRTEDAIESFEKALELYKQLYQKTHHKIYLNYQALTLMNEGLAYKRLKKLGIAEDYLNRARKVFLIIKDSNSFNQCNANLAEIMFFRREFRKSINYSWQAINYFQRAGLYHDLMLSALQIAEDYDSLGILDKELKVLSWARKYMDSVETDLQFQRHYFHALAQAYYKNNYPDSAYNFLSISYNLTDSLLSYRIKRNVSAAMEKFRSKQKQKEIELLKKQKALQQKTIHFQNLILLVFIIAFIIFLVYSLVLVRLVKKIKHQNQALQELNAEITQQKEEILTQKEALEKQNKSITESIQYASRIQRALLPSRDVLNWLFPENFIFYRPRDYVSGDFYWFYLRGNKFIVTVADCTGHGVPGSLMTMLGLSFLSEIVKGQEFKNSAQILNILREQVKHSLKQEAKGEIVTKDGMDMALLIIDLKTLVAEYAGAYNPLIIIDQGRIIEYKADKMPVGIFFREKPSFTNHRIQLKENQMVYLFSDGFIDQFGSRLGKKYLYKRFKELLVNISEHTAQDQFALLSEEFDRWKGTVKQLDDVTVLGMRIRRVKQ